LEHSSRALLIEPGWAKRYGRRVELGKLPDVKAAMTARTEEVGQDGQKTATAAWAGGTSSHLRLLPQVGPLRQVWVHHDYWDVDGSALTSTAPHSWSRRRTLLTGSNSKPRSKEDTSQDSANVST
jgi:hypothetical protein